MNTGHNAEKDKLIDRTRNEDKESRTEVTNLRDGEQI